VKISLTPETEQLIAEKVESGHYHSADEVVREGLALLEARERNRKEDVDTGPQESLADAFAAIAAEVPEEEWARVPTDLSKQVDHYLYGSDKKS
jgi:putative addiction module CopG family antidote